MKPAMIYNVLVLLIFVLKGRTVHITNGSESPYDYEVIGEVEDITVNTNGVLIFHIRGLGKFANSVIPYFTDVKNTMIDILR